MKRLENIAFTLLSLFQSLQIMLQDYFCIQLRQSVRLALPLENVAEVITLGGNEICPIPGVTPALLGVVNQRGQLLWVLELGDFLTDLLGLVPSPIQYRKWERLTLLVINAKPAHPLAEQTAPRLGCVVSALKGIVPVNPAKLNPLPANFSPAFSTFFSGVTEIEDLPIAVLNVSAVFAALRIVET